MFSFDLLQNKVVLVSGATSGIGTALTRQLRRCGASLSVTSMRPQALHALADELDAHAIVGDPTNAKDCARIVDEARECHSRIDALVNCVEAWSSGDSGPVAGRDGGCRGDADAEGSLLLCSHAIPALKATRGVIVNVASVAGLVGTAGGGVHGASDGGLDVRGKALALALAPFGVRVNTVCPADVATPMLWRQAEHHNAADPQAYLDQLLSQYPQRAQARFIEPGEVACCIVFLLSAAAAPITGASIRLDFGIAAA